MATGFELPIIPAQIPSQASVITPADLQPLIDKLYGSGQEGFMQSQDIMTKATTAQPEAEARKAKAEASTARSKQDVIDEQGVQPKKSIVARIFGGKPAGQPAAPAPAAPAAPTSSGMSGIQHLSTEELMKIAGGAGYTFGP